MEISLASLMIHNPSSVADLGLKFGMDIDLNPEHDKPNTVAVELGGARIKL